jgi:hypothetical protein
MHLGATGQLHPLAGALFDRRGEGTLIDGRNRLAACKLAGVEPTFETRSGDPTAFILSQNVRRRHMTAGQRAMATAMLYREPIAYKRGGKSFAAKELSGSLSKARALSGDVGVAPGNFRTAVLKFKIVSFASSIPKLSLDSPRNSTRRALYRTHYMFGVHVRIQHRLAIAHSLHLEELMSRLSAPLPRRRAGGFSVRRDSDGADK